MRRSGESKKKPDTINQVLDFLKTHYDFRRNVILDRLEYRNFNEKEERWKGRFRPMRTRSYNAIFLDLQLAGIKCFRNYLQTVIDSFIPQGLQSLHGVYRETETMGRSDRLHRPVGGYRTGGRPGVLEEKFQEVVRGNAGLCIAGRHREPPGNHTLLRTGKGKEHMDKKAAAARVEGILPERNGQPRKQGPPAAAQHPPHHQHGRVRRGKGRRPSRAEEGNHTGERHGTESVRRAGVHLHTARIFHCQHQQPPMPAGHRGNRRFLPSSIISLDYRTPVNYEGVYAQAHALLKQGYQYWYEGEEIDELNRHNELHRMKDPVEENLLVYFRARARRDLREMDARSHHTQQDSHLRKDTGEQADDTDTGDVARKIRVQDKKEQSGKHRI